MRWEISLRIKLPPVTEPTKYKLPEVLHNLEEILRHLTPSLRIDALEGVKESELIELEGTKYFQIKEELEKEL